MKNYDELTNNLLERRDRYVLEQRKKRRAIGITTSLCCICLVALLGLGMWQSEMFAGLPPATLDDSIVVGDKDYINPDESTQQPNESTPTVGLHKAESTFVLLCATTDNTSKEKLQENILTPFKTEIRIRNIAGMSDVQLLEIIEEEDAYAKQLNATYPGEVGYGRWRRENVIISTINTGRFVVQFKNQDTVSKIRISASDKGILNVFPKAPGCVCTTNGNMTIALDKDGIEEICAKTTSGGVELHWQISSKLADLIDENPTNALSEYSDTLTFTVEHSDGRTEVAIVDMTFDDNGQVYAVLREMNIVI